MKWVTEMPDQRGGSIGESTLTVKWWAVLTVIIGIYGFMFISMMNHENRLTKFETQVPYITESLTEIRTVMKEVRDDQIRRYEKELRQQNGPARRQ